jgi:hypothetical protein
MRDPTDSIVLAAVTDWLAEPAFLDAMHRHLNPDSDTRDQAELEQVEGRLVDLARRFANGDLLELEHAAARSELIARRKALLAVSSRPVPSVDLDGMRDSWAQALDADDMSVLRRWVALVSQPVVIHAQRGDRVEITPAWI